MTSRDFAYWLQGYFEISNPETISNKETEMIKKHLNLVFKHEIDPSMGNEQHQQELNNIHNTKPTLEDLGEKYGFEVNKVDPKWGVSPGPNHKLGIHGWYNPEEGTPRC